MLLIAVAVISQAFIQETEARVKQEEEKKASSDTSNNFMLVVGNDLISVKEQDSSVNIKVGNRGLSLLESLEGGRRLEFEKHTDSDENNDERRHAGYQDDDDDDYNRHSGARSFRGHLAGIEAGFNNYNHITSMALPDAISYMSLNTSSSNCFNITFSQLSLGFSRHIGIVTGAGLNWNNYRFEGMNTITIDDNGRVAGLVPDRPSPLKKSKFSTLYLNIPVLLEIQIPAGYSHHLNVAAGVIGGLKLNAWTKMVFEDEEKYRTNGDFNLNLLRGGATARIGYGNFMIYGTYYLTPWFQELKGPGGYSLEPFEIGIAFTFND